jgi:hypothetical protein
MCFTSKYQTTASRAKENRIEDIHKRNRDVILKQEKKKSWAINTEHDYDYFPRSSDPTVAPSDAPASAAAVNSS